MPASWICWDIILIIGIICLMILDNHNYRIRYARKIKKIKTQKDKKKIIELKWPDNLPRFF